MKNFIYSTFLLALGFQGQSQILGQVIGQVRNLPSTIKEGAVFQKKKSYVNVGVGFPNLFFKASDITGIISGQYTTEKKGFLTTMATYEYALKPNIGIGLMLGYSKGEFRYVSNSNANNYFGFKGSFLNIGLLSNYHIYSDKNVDVYSGAMLVYNSKKITNNSSGNTSITIPILGTFDLFSLVTAPTAPPILYQLSVGIRAFPFKTKQVGFFAEGGYGITAIKAGVAAKF
jgi:hypothetical protein